MDMEMCTCEYEHHEPHHCPFSSEIYDDYTVCNCCEFCEDQCAQGI